MKLLLLNPNTSLAVTDRLLAAAREAAPDLALTAATARFGAAYIASRAAAAIAGHAALDLLAEHAAGQDAALLCCFGLPCLPALAEISPIPLAGMTEAACAEGARHGRFAILTGGAAWGPMLREFAALHGLAGLTEVRTLAPDAAALAAERARGIAALAAEARQAARAGASAVVLGGAGLAGFAAAVEAASGVPVICPVRAGLAAARAARLGSRGAPVASRGLAAPLAALLAAKDPCPGGRATG